MHFERMNRKPVSAAALVAGLGALAFGSSGCNGCGFSVENSCAIERTCPAEGGTAGNVMGDVEGSTIADSTIDTTSNPSREASPMVDGSSAAADSSPVNGDGSVPPVDGGPDHVDARDMDGEADAAPDVGGPSLDAATDSGPCGALTNCSGICINTEGNDPKNCGACGHDCGSGACTGGTCAPWLVTSPFANSNGVTFEYTYGGSTSLAFAFDGTSVAWTSQMLSAPGAADTASAANIFTGAVTSLYPNANFAALREIAVANGTVVWGAHGNTMTLFSSPANLAMVTTADAFSQSGYYGLALDPSASRAYTLNLSAGGAFSASVCSMGSPGTCKNYTLDASLTYNAIGVLGITAGSSPSYLFWTAIAGAANTATLHDFNLSRFADETLTTFTNGGEAPGYLVSDGTYIYWFDLSNSPYSIRRIQQGMPGTPSTFQSPVRQSGGSTWDGIASDGQNLYFANDDALGIWSIDYVSVTGGTAGHLLTMPINVTIASVRAAGGYLVWIQTACAGCSGSTPQIWALRLPTP